jgi:hypothetical protein
MLRQARQNEHFLRPEGRGRRSPLWPLQRHLLAPAGAMFAYLCVQCNLCVSNAAVLTKRGAAWRHPPGVNDLRLMRPAFEAAGKRWPGVIITLRNGARIIEKT